MIGIQKRTCVPVILNYVHDHNCQSPYISALIVPPSCISMTNPNCKANNVTIKES
ncbi:hypothetical protein HanRHA438_Chr07g0292451 [Helianthus annuus]|nr:hypothetical protein HanRHA438_Chr07g0292451 [Helianthus annuus]